LEKNFEDELFWNRLSAQQVHNAHRIVVWANNLHKVRFLTANYFSHSAFKKFARAATRTRGTHTKSLRDGSKGTKHMPYHPTNEQTHKIQTIQQ
jgi:hypothetical protein